MAEDATQQLKEMNQLAGKFIANFELAYSELITSHNKLQDIIADHHKHFNSQLSDIREVTEELRSVLTEAGAARWRIAAENALCEGEQHRKLLETTSEQHLGMLQESNQELLKVVKKSFDRLDRAANFTVKNISDAIASFHVRDFQNLTERSHEAVRQTSIQTVRHLKKLSKWFHWKNLALASVIALTTSFVTAFYLNDEFPWENRKQVVMQRNAGQALITAWPNLSQAERDRIMDYAQQSSSLA